MCLKGPDKGAQVRLRWRIGVDTALSHRRSKDRSDHADRLIINSIVKPGGSQSLDGFVHARGVVDVEYPNNSHHSRPQRSTRARRKIARFIETGNEDLASFKKSIWIAALEILRVCPSLILFSIHLGKHSAISGGQPHGQLKLNRSIARWRRPSS